MKILFSLIFLTVVAVGTASAVFANDADKRNVTEAIAKHWGSKIEGNVKTVRKDYTCDGKQDVVMGRVNGDHYDLLVITEDGGTLHSENVEIPFTGASTSIGLCYEAGRDTEPMLDVDKKWPDEEVEQIFGAVVCAQPIIVSEENCDPQYYFWSPAGAQSKLAPYRT